MKHFNRSHLAILPLLSILAMSPSVMESQFSGRHIASVVEEVKGHPKYEAIVSKVDPKSITKDLDITVDKFKVKRDELSAKLKKEREEFKKDQSDKVIVEEQRKNVEKLVVEVLLVEGSLKDLQEKKGIEQAEDEASQKLITESKDIVEGLLTDLEANEVLVAKASEPKQEEPKVAEEPKKEEPKKEEPKKEEEKKEEVAKEEDKKEEKKEVCEAEEKNKVLSAQIEDLLKQQSQIMQTLVGMAQMMVNMYQQNMSNQQQQQQQQQQPFQYPNQMAYQYQQPMTAGNWVYYPQGFQPSQPNIFAQAPMTQYQAQQQQGGFYPDQMYMPQQPQQQWGMQPQNYFNNDLRYSPQPITYGSFGNDPFSFPMSAGPTLSMR